MAVTNEAMVNLTVGTAGLVGVLGYAVVFIGLIALMAVITIVGKIMAGKAKAEAAAPAEASSEKPNLPEAAGSAGELKLHDVSERDAAMLMAIVAHKTGKPLNTLRFRSIKEVKKDEV